MLYEKLSVYRLMPEDCVKEAGYVLFARDPSSSMASAPWELEYSTEADFVEEPDARPHFRERLESRDAIKVFEVRI